MLQFIVRKSVIFKILLLHLFSQLFGIVYPSNGLLLYSISHILFTYNYIPSLLSWSSTSTLLYTLQYKFPLLILLPLCPFPFLKYIRAISMYSFILFFFTDIYIYIYTSILLNNYMLNFINFRFYFKF